MSAARIRPYRPADRAGVERLFAATWAADGYPAGVSSAGGVPAWLWRVRPDRRWVAVVGGELGGHVATRSARGHEHAAVWVAATGRPADELTVVVRLAVHPHARGAGVGLRLVDAARASGGTLVLDALADRNLAGRLYRRAGFSVVGESSYRAPDGSVHRKLLWAVV